MPSLSIRFVGSYDPPRLDFRIILIFPYRLCSVVISVGFFLGALKLSWEERLTGETLMSDHFAAILFSFEHAEYSYWVLFRIRETKETCWESQYLNNKFLRLSSRYVRSSPLTFQSWDA